MDRIQRINSRFKYENEGRSSKHNQMMDGWLVQSIGRSTEYGGEKHLKLQLHI